MTPTMTTGEGRSHSTLPPRSRKMPGVSCVNLYLYLQKPLRLSLATSLACACCHEVNEVVRVDCKDIDAETHRYRRCGERIGGPHGGLKRLAAFGTVDHGASVARSIATAVGLGGYRDSVDQFLEWVPLLGALGVGGAIGNYVGAGRSRREVRSAILQAIANTEKERWSKDPDGNDYSEFVIALRELETASLIARVPRDAVHHYVVLAEAARILSDDAVDFFPGDSSFWGPIDGYFDTLVRNSAAVLTRLAWSPWRARIKLRWNLRKLRARALKFDDETIRWRLAAAQKRRGPLPGKLGELPGIEDPPQYVQIPKKPKPGDDQDS
jgi:hypothetical protein